MDAEERDRLVAELQAQATELLAITRRMRAIAAVLDRHGTGPYPAEDLAVFAEQDLDTVRRVLAELASHGLIERADRDT